MTEVTDIKGIGPSKADTLAEEGYDSVAAIADAEPEDLAEIKGVGDDLALEYVAEAKDELTESRDDSEAAEEASDEFDLTPAEVGDELEEDEGEVVEEDVEETKADGAVDEPDEDAAPVDPTFEISLDFDSRLQFDVFHAALMRHHERVYTSYQPASDAMQGLLDGLDSFDSVEYELTEFELNTLHTAIKKTRTNYQGENLIDHMDSLREVENQIDEARQTHLF